MALWIKFNWTDWNDQAIKWQNVKKILIQLYYPTKASSQSDTESGGET